MDAELSRVAKPATNLTENLSGRRPVMAREYVDISCYVSR